MSVTPWNRSSQLFVPAADLPRVSRVRLEIVPDPLALHGHFARSIADEIQANNQVGRPTRLILPVGPTGQYPILARICNQERISWRNVHTFNMDEYCDWQGRAVPITHPLSFEGTMHRLLFDALDPGLRIPEEQAHFPDPLNLERISERIRDVGGIDTCYGGIGYHGHVAFNEPPISRWYKLTCPGVPQFADAHRAAGTGDGGAEQHLRDRRQSGRDASHGCDARHGRHPGQPAHPALLQWRELAAHGAARRAHGR